MKLSGLFVTALNYRLPGAVLQRFGWQTRNVDAGAAVHPWGFLSHKRALSLLGQLGCQCFSAFAEADDQIIECSHEIVPPFSS